MCLAVVGGTGNRTRGLAFPRQALFITMLPSKSRLFSDSLTTECLSTFDVLPRIVLCNACLYIYSVLTQWSYLFLLGILPLIVFSFPFLLSFSYSPHI